MIKRLIRAALDLPYKSLTANDVDELKDLSVTFKSEGLAARMIAESPDMDMHSIRWSREIWLLNRQRHVTYLQETRRLTQLLMSAGIKCVCLKGVDFSEKLYPDAGERSSRDIDMLVSKDELLKAREVLLSNGYYHRPLIHSLEAMVRWQHDAVVLVSAEKNEYQERFKVELHQTRNFHGLQIESVFHDAVYDHEKGYTSPGAVDTLILCAWHVYHHVTEMEPNDTLVAPRVTVKKLLDFWRALQMYYFNAPDNLNVITSRSEILNATVIMRVAIKRLLDLYAYVGASNERLLVLYRQFAASCSIERLLDDTWKYGSYTTSFWKFAFHPSEELQAIKQAAREERLCSFPAYRASPYVQDQFADWITVGSAYEAGMDRLESCIQEGREGSKGLPAFSWCLQWDEQFVHMQLRVHTTRVIGLAKEDPWRFPWGFTDGIAIQFYANDRNASAQFCAGLCDQQAQLRRLIGETGEIVQDHDWHVQGLHASGYLLTGTIPCKELPFTLHHGRCFKFRVRYFDYLSDDWELHTHLVWPSPFFEGEIELSPLT